MPGVSPTGALLEVDICPLKPNQFATAQSGEGLQLDHRVKRICNSLRIAMISPGLRIAGVFCRLALCRTLVMGFFSAHSHLIALGIQGAHNVANFGLAPLANGTLVFGKHSAFNQLGAPGGVVCGAYRNGIHTGWQLRLRFGIIGT
jgi:hypothetical protein